VFVFLADPNYGDSLDVPNFKALIDEIYADGVEIIGHSITEDTDGRTTVTDRLLTLSQYNAKNWIDHGFGAGDENWEAICSQGAIQGDDNYILDILDAYNYQYAWSGIDMSVEGINMIAPSNRGLNSSFFFYNNQVDDDIYDDKKLYLWSSFFTQYHPTNYYTEAHVDTLKEQRGIHIGHEYFGFYLCEGYTYHDVGGTKEIMPAFETQLDHIASHREAGDIWSPTMAKMGDYLVALKDVFVKLNTNGTYTVKNNGLTAITGITLLTESNINSILINTFDLVSFGGSFGNKEIVLPTLAAGDSFILTINYGNKDINVPTVISNDTGKNKVNEITAYYASGQRRLIMTAEGVGNRSFTARVPDFANKLVTLKEGGSTLAKYWASNSGEITFSVPLSSLHTFWLEVVSNWGFISGLIDGDYAYAVDFMYFTYVVDYALHLHKIEDLTDQIDGVNQIFFTYYTFKQNSTIVYKNGLAMEQGIDYLENFAYGNILMLQPPEMGSILWIYYQYVTPA
jgi:hypothetical protein